VVDLIEYLIARMVFENNLAAQTGIDDAGCTVKSLVTSTDALRNEEMQIDE
jgi:hypothetical protein